MRKYQFLVIAIMSAVAVAASGGGLAAAADDPILARQELMENTRDAVKALMGMVKGEAAFDAATVEQGLAVMRKTADEAGALFPVGSESGHDTEAGPAIWTDRAGFDARLQDFGTAVAAAQAAPPQSLDTLQPAMDSVLKTCKGCHDDFRIEKD